MPLLLKTDNLSKSFGPRTLFRGISLSLTDDQIVGLIGPNGSGKSTLLRILADLEHADAGSIELRRNTRVDYLAQEDVFLAGATVEEVMLAAFPENDPRDQHEREVESAIQLGKVGFSDFSQKAESLSGGWRKRLALARELVKKPDLLLLDEPTNHLDLEGILWLEKLLAESRFACLLVSHDRYFLENIAGRIIELNSAYPDGYLSHEGSYSDFLEKREEFLAAQAAREQSLASSRWRARFGVRSNGSSAARRRGAPRRRGASSRRTR
jgi:ATP-binding cassette subfamily F protein uup